MSDRDASLDEASNIAFKALKEKPPAKPVDLYYIPWSWKKTSVCDKMFKTVLEEKYELYRKRERVF